MLIDLIDSLYAIIMSGVCLSLLVAVLFYWYATSVDLKQTDDFDKKYRESRLDKDVYKKDRW